MVPRQHSDVLPGAKILIVANNRPVMSDVGMSLQTSERLAVCDEYFETRMQIEKSMLANVDTYTLGRVIMKMPSRHAMYSKIIHKQLNTMSVNEKWTGTDNKCPVCMNGREDWMHPLVCQSPDTIRV